jgi:hypothetical protein
MGQLTLFLPRTGVCTRLRRFFALRADECNQDIKKVGIFPVFSCGNITPGFMMVPLLHPRAAVYRRLLLAHGMDARQGRRFASRRLADVDLVRTENLIS